MLVLPSEYVGQSAVEQFVHAFGVDVALVVDTQHVLRSILRGLSPHLLAAELAVESRVMAWAVHGLVAGVVTERKALVRARG